MMTHSLQLEKLIDAYLAGEPVDVPPEQRAEFERAVAAHRALRDFLEPTIAPEAIENAAGARFGSAERQPPILPADYAIERELGQGGMGVVYLARQRSLNREVALKVLRPGEQAAGRLLKRFRDEAQHLARLRHPNIVSIHEVGETAGEPYFTMDYIDGEPLSAELARGAMSPSRAVAILKQVAAAVQHAHRQGIVHRDLKPGNVLLDKAGRVFVTDFGLARDISQASSLTLSGELLGTPQYMSPEQVRGETALIGEATDVHALGLLLFEMLTGRPAFSSSSPAEVLVKLLHDAPPPLRSLDRRIPRDLETICQKMVQKSPAARYTTVTALLEDLRRYEAGEPLLARRDGMITRAVRWSQRHWKTVTTAVATAVAAAALTLAATLLVSDKSYDELIVWGDEELANGQPDVAARVYSRALARAEGAQRMQVAERMVQTGRQLDDGKTAVELAMQVIDLLPEASFGKHDFLIAQALVSRTRAKSPHGVIDIWHERPAEDLKLVEARLERALETGVPEAQRLETEETLQAIKIVLGADNPYARREPTYLYTLPAGSAAELQTTLDDAGQPAWNRARAGIALGRLHEEQRRTAQAITAYHAAYELLRRVYPMYGGVKASIGAQPSRVGVPDAEECKLVRDLVASLRRLDPAAMALPQGGLEFSVTGFRLPPTIGIELTLELCDPEVAHPDEGLSHNLPRLVPLRQDGPVTVQLLDGRYRLRSKGTHSRWDNSVEKVARRLEVDVENWPAEVEIRGGIVQLPPVRIRLADEVTFLSPDDAVPVNLNDVEFRWEPVPGATRYQVNVVYTTEKPSPTTYFFLTVTTREPMLKLSELPAHEQKLVRENLLPGRTGGWRVDAYDEADRRVGKTLAERRFLVADALTSPATE